MLKLKVNFLEYLNQGTLGFHPLSSLLFRRFSSPTNIHTCTPANYSHSTTISLHSVGTPVRESLKLHIKVVVSIYDYMPS